jgi:hypothetical protein
MNNTIINGRGYLPGPLRLLRTYLPGPLRLLRTYLPGPLQLLRPYLPGPLRKRQIIWQITTHCQGQLGCVTTSFSTVWILPLSNKFCLLGIGEI